MHSRFPYGPKTRERFCFWSTHRGGRCRPVPGSLDCVKQPLMHIVRFCCSCCCCYCCWSVLSCFRPAYESEPTAMDTNEDHLQLHWLQLKMHLMLLASCVVFFFVFERKSVHFRVDRDIVAAFFFSFFFVYGKVLAQQMTTESDLISQTNVCHNFVS